MFNQLSIIRPVRRLFAAVFAVLGLTVAGPALAQTVQLIHFPGPSGEVIEAAVWTPDTPSTAPRPLVVISHGSVGSLSGHKDTAEALARSGFLVAALSHPGDNFRDMSRTWRLTDRPAQVSALIDYMTGDWSGAAGVDPSRIGAFGFSAGGFTVVTLAGGQSSATAIVDHCAAHPEFLLCQLLGPKGIDVGTWRPSGYDARIKAAVIAAPGFGFSFSEDSLRAIHIPVQLWQAGADQILIAPWHVEPVRDRLPDVDYHRVDGALHHDFLAPCDPVMAQAVPDLCRSNPGFDRAAFKQTFNGQVVAFFKKHLGQGMAGAGSR